ncbi:MAG: hypothetical protein IT551_10670, partial [Novosphingobium sp.]|nr:hypothetical protein [Novosphingobium sp.]
MAEPLQRAITGLAVAALKAASRTAFTARKSVSSTSDLPLARVMAALLALGAPAQVIAQSVQTDQELQALIPDSAVQNADAWAIDTDAARTGAPPDTLIEEIEADTVMPDIPGMTIAWPDGSELPKIEALSPDPDIDVAEQSTDAAVEALPGQEETDSGVGIKLVDADIARVGSQVELAFPRGTDAIAEKDAIAARFAGLSALKSFDDDEDNLAQIVRRARTDRELLINILRIHGYYDAQVYQSLGGLSAPGEGDAAAPIDVEKVVVRFDLQPGPQYRFGQIEFGDLAATGSGFAALRSSFKISSGDAVNSDRIVAERFSL